LTDPHLGLSRFCLLVRNLQMDGRFGIEQFEALGIDDSSDGLRAARQVGMLQINLGVAHRIVEADICIRKSNEC
jgi:beta-phosphoglucomutase-like phosphatase (HAD superfamily)